MRSLITPDLKIDARAVGLEAIAEARADQRSEAKRFSPAMRTPYLRLLRMALDYKRKVAANELYQAFVMRRRQKVGATAARIEDLTAEIDRIDNPSTRPGRYFAFGGRELLAQDLGWMRAELAALQSEKEAA